MPRRLIYTPGPVYNSVDYDIVVLFNVTVVPLNFIVMLILSAGLSLHLTLHTCVHSCMVQLQWRKHQSTSIGGDVATGLSLRCCNYVVR